MKKYDGVGLAAPQINVPLRLFIWNVDKQFGVAANPTLELSGEEITYPEGCLSIPNKYFPLPRYNKAILTARNLEGEEFQIEAEGWLARCFQHEVDHLDKLLITDRIEQWIAGVAQEKQPLKKEDSVEEPSVI